MTAIGVPRLRAEPPRLTHLEHSTADEEVAGGAVAYYFKKVVLKRKVLHRSVYRRWNMLALLHYLST